VLSRQMTRLSSRSVFAVVMGLLPGKGHYPTGWL
jgi:hypothetical protein